MSSLQIAGFLDHSTVNGLGLRSVLFVSGCRHYCQGCQNKVMQSPSYGEVHSITELYQRILKNKPLIDGVTFSGGEPFDQAEGLVALATLLRQEGLSIWAYTGYIYEELLTDDLKSHLLELIDVLVDGPFIENLYNASLRYRGSSNQRFLKLNHGKIIEELFF
ncbi:anaerobic ribonucleoside-triphosphate reductase activating protein [Sporanaerobium hydrogeniformans]|uniref:Anaerobic ribonucleoside-triphosphate reductase activating protein n=1 Tax=Sporanaerobium hydrogeniformans TaxID=3072179 RepID=A0AC61DHN6_9FIRM|nr:anaerobic ribonucleoside-triphosphate reductase activating protein [Sporanaerobium hydrogeniformans]PHV72312.1 anaerobic ribonucleoside-triphosphate reductase activating protein [Sporanaerobium hydrogeniformans]